MLGIAIGAALACALAFALIFVHRNSQPSSCWFDILAGTLVNGVLAGFLAGVVRGPAKAGRLMRLPSIPPRQIPHTIRVYPYLGAVIGGVLAIGAHVTMQMNANLVTAIVRDPSETWASIWAHGGDDLAAHVVFGVILGSIAAIVMSPLLEKLEVPSKAAALQEVAEPHLDEGRQPASRDFSIPRALGEDELLTGPETETGDMTTLMKQATSALHNKDYNRVLALLEPARTSFPDALSVAYLLGEGYAGLGRNEEAEKEFRRAVDIDPNNHVSHYNLGCLMRDVGDVEGARHEFQETVNLNPFHANGWINLSELMDQPEGAIQCLERARRCGCQDKELDAVLSMWRGIVRDKVDMGPLRLVWAEEALAKNDVAYALIHLAMARRLELNDCGRALACKIESDIAKRRGNLPKSVELLREAIRIDSEPPTLWNTLSAREILLARREGRREQAAILLRQALEHALEAIRRQDYPRPHQNAALAYLALGRLQDARDHAQKARDMVRAELAGTRACAGCPAERKSRAECEECLRKAEGTLSDIDLASGDYRAT